MHIQRLVVAACSLACASACTGDMFGNRGVTVIPPLAYLRYFNAVGDTLALDFRPIDQIEPSPPFAAVPFRGTGLGSYQGYQAGSRKIRVVPSSPDIATASSILVDTTLFLAAGSFYTVVHTGFARSGQAPKQGLRVILDEFPVGGQNIAIRMIHAGALLGAVDLYLTPTTTDPLPAAATFANVTYGTVQTYTTRAPGAFVIRGYATGTRVTALFSNAAPLAPTTTSGNSSTGGADAAGTVFTVVVYGAATPGSSASVTAGNGVNTTPRVIYWIDRSPPGVAP